MSKIARMRIAQYIAAIVFSAVLFAACGEDKSVPKETDTPTSGSLRIVADESFQPVIEEEVKVFTAKFPDAKITVEYVSEADAIRAFLEKKSKLVIVSRNLTEKEQAYCAENKIVPTSLDLARDAVAVIRSRSAVDTAFSLTSLQGIIGGSSAKKYTVVFDNSGSSTLRFITDSLMRGMVVGKNLFAAKGNKAVIDYVSQNLDAIGFVGLTYVTDTIDSMAESFSTNVKIAAIYNDTMQQYYQPFQAEIALKHYPLVRKMTYLKNETYQGLASGFCNFMASDVGQLIMGRARQLPLRMSIVIREAAINTEPQQ